MPWSLLMIGEVDMWDPYLLLPLPLSRVLFRNTQHPPRAVAIVGAIVGAIRGAMMRGAGGGTIS